MPGSAPNEILSPLGAGGIGEVYRAKDTRLHRDVAIKVLPEALAGDPDTLNRSLLFVRTRMSTLIIRFALVAVAAALVILALTNRLFSSSPLVIAAQVFAVSLSVWARRSFPTRAFRVAATPAADAVIQRGPYRLIRHPMYAAALLFAWAGILSHLSALTLAVGIILTGVVTMRIVLEERLLRECYPEYSTYVRSTKAVVPYVL